MIHTPAASRRAILRGVTLIGVGSNLVGLPLCWASAKDAAAWPQVGKLMTDYVDSRKVASMVAALGWRQGSPEIIGRGRDSFTSDRMSDGDSLFRIYSMTKPITGMAAMILIDEGKLGLDQPLAEILPAFARMQVQKVYDGPVTADNLEPAVRPITIRQMLTHTSGLGYGIVQTGPIAQLMRDRGVVPGVVTRLEVPGQFRGIPAPSLAEFADRLAQIPLVYQPGTRWSYSTGADLMGRVIEVVSGVPFDAFVQQRLFNPLGMTSTWFQVPRRERFRMTANYFKLGGVLLPIDLGESSLYLDKPAYPFGGAGLVSSARDYDRFLKMLAGNGVIEGKRVMSEAAVRMGTSNLLPGTLLPTDTFTKDYDFGAFGRVGRGKEAGTYGWFGAAGTIGLVDMGRGLRQTLMTQYMPSNFYPLPTEFPVAVGRDAAALSQVLR